MRKGLGTLVDRMQRDGIASVQDGDKNFAGVKSNTRRMMKDFDLATDKEVLTRMMESFIDNVPREMWGEHPASRTDGCGKRRAPRCRAHRLPCGSTESSW